MPTPGRYQDQLGEDPDDNTKGSPEHQSVPALGPKELSKDKTQPSTDPGTHADA
jgi:hypothetical protein